MSKRAPLKPWLRMTEVERTGQAFARTFNPIQRKINRRRLQNLKRQANVNYLQAAKGETDPWKRLEIRREIDSYYKPFSFKPAE